MGQSSEGRSAQPLGLVGFSLQLSLRGGVGDAIAVRGVEKEQAHASGAHDHIVHVRLDHTIQQALRVPRTLGIELDAIRLCDLVLCTRALLQQLAKVGQRRALAAARIQHVHVLLRQSEKVCHTLDRCLIGGEVPRFHEVARQAREHQSHVLSMKEKSQPERTRDWLI